MKRTLNAILKKCKFNRKYKKNFILYLSSLDFDEFGFLYFYYTSIIIKRYKSEYKLFSKQWFKTFFLAYKLKYILNIFNSANSEYILRLKNNVEQLELLKNEIDENFKILSKIQTDLFIGENLKKDDIIRSSISLSESIFLTDKITKLMIDYKNLTLFKEKTL